MAGSKREDRRAEAPRSVGGLLRAIAGALVRGLVWRLMFAMAIGFAIWIAHTYLVVVINEGFHVSSGAWHRHWLAVRGQRAVGALAWAVPSFALFWVLRRVVLHPWRFTRSAVMAPLVWWRHSRASGLWVPAAGAAGLALGLAMGTASSAVAWVVGWLLLTAFALLEPRRSASAWLGRLLTGRGDGGATVGWMGLGVGLLLALPLPLQPWLGGATAGLLALGAVPLALLAWRQPRLAVLLLAGLSASALADDGGWREAGGTFDQWVTSTGATEAMLSGLGPAFASVIAILTALGWPDLPELPSLERILDAVEGADPKAKDPWFNPPRWLADLKDGVSFTFGTQTAQGLLRTLFEGLKGVDPEAYAQMMREQLEILDGGMVRFRNPAIRDAFLERMREAARNVQRLGDALTVVGVVWDTLDNISKGDNAFFALGKASGAGAIMMELGNKDPALAVMELTNFVLFGGSEAGKSISPGKNITGGFSLLMDTAYDIAHGTDRAQDRIAKGDYGETLKNVNEAAAIAAEYWEDPETVGEELANWISDDQSWEEAYDRSHEIWKPEPGANAVRRVGAAAGEIVTDGFIKAGELAAKAGQWAGERAALMEQAWNRWFG